jgi:hypothetical protein
MSRVSFLTRKLAHVTIFMNSVLKEVGNPHFSFYVGIITFKYEQYIPLSVTPN